MAWATSGAANVPLNESGATRMRRGTAGNYCSERAADSARLAASSVVCRALSSAFDSMSFDICGVIERTSNTPARPLCPVFRQFAHPASPCRTCGAAEAAPSS